MKEIISIGIQIPSNEIDFYRMNERVALSDADIIVFSPILSRTLYRTEHFDYQGKICYDENSSFNLNEDFMHWERELKKALEQGKTIFVFLTKKEEFYIYLETQNLLDNKKKINNYICLPIIINTQSASGKIVYCQSPFFKNFHNEFKEELYYETYISAREIKESDFTTKSKDRCLGATIKYLNGHIIFLPMLNCNKNSFWNQNEKPSKVGEQFGKRLISSLAEIDKALRSHTEKTPRPEWINISDFELKKVVKTKEEIQSNLEKIKKIEDENNKLKEILIEQDSLSDLLFEGGKALENAVIKALQILGYSAENYNDGVLELDQIIVSPENDRFIGECEGKESKDIDVSKFRQLQDALNEDFQRDEVEEKAFGLLFGNPQRLLNPKERTLDFTKKCKLGAEREKIGLIKTADLFIIAKYLSEKGDESYKSKCRKAIKEQLGQVVIFPELPSASKKTNK